MKNPLTLNQLSKLDRLEGIIKRGQQTFAEVGSALCTIRDEKLFLRDFESFEGYCQSKWGWSRQHSSRLINAAELVDKLPPTLADHVVSERDARALLPLEPKEQKQAIREAAKEGVPVAGVAKSFSDKPTSNGRAQVVRPAKKPDIILDKCGYPIPKPALEYWERSGEVQEMLTALSHMRTELERRQKDNDPMWREVNFSTAIAELSNAYTNVKTAMPYAVCTACQGLLPAKCTLCRGRGLISEFRWKTVPEEQRKMRTTK